MAPVNHTTLGGEYRRGLDSKQIPSSYSSLEVYLRGVIKIIGIGSGSVITCKRLQVFGWKVHF